MRSGEGMGRENGGGGGGYRGDASRGIQEEKDEDGIKLRLRAGSPS